jgi:hypothetical protein
MKLRWISTGISELVIDWLDKQAEQESKKTGQSVSRADLIRRAIGEMKQREQEAQGKP